MVAPGLIISKLGVQAIASDDSVTGWIFLKVSLPRDTENRSTINYILFTNPPRLLSHPIIHSLPLPPSNHLPRALQVAATLLSLPPRSTYPPSSSSHVPSSSKPRIEIGKKGEVGIVIEPIRARKSANIPTGRNEYVVCLEFESAISRGAGGKGIKTAISLPRCLDNIIRLQILPPSNGPSNLTDEVNITTEPKILPLPPDTFSSSSSKPTMRETLVSRKGVKSVGCEEGWEDGEDLGDEEYERDMKANDEVEDDGEEEDETGGCWLEGRFQSTDILRLEWSFSTTSPSPSTLDIRPNYNQAHSTIDLKYTASIHPASSASDFGSTTIPLEFVIPEGWGWSDLHIQGRNLLAWRSMDTDYWDVNLLEGETTLDPGFDPDTTVDDSFSTIRARKSTSPSRPPVFEPKSTPPMRSSASLMRQALPAELDMQIEDFSFEMQGIQEQYSTATPPTVKYTNEPILTSRPGTKSSQRGQSESTRSSSTSHRDVLPGRLFDVEFAIEKGEDVSIQIEGTLAPVSRLSFISPSLPLPIPYVRLGTDSQLPSCAITCPKARYDTHVSDNQPTSEPHIVDIANNSQIGAFTWTLSSPASPPAQINGPIHIAFSRSSWGIRSYQVRIPLPKRKRGEIGFTLPLDTNEEFRIVRAVISGRGIPRAWSRSKEEVDVRIGIDGTAVEGRWVDVGFEILESSTGAGDQIVVGLPTFPIGSGKVIVEIKGNDLAVTPTLNGIDTHPDRPNTYTYDMTQSSTRLRLSRPIMTKINSVEGNTSKRGQRRTLFSAQTALMMFLLYVLISLGLQVQRLQGQVAFVVDEARDLRLYGMGRADQNGDRSWDASTAGAENQRDNRATAREDVIVRSGSVEDAHIEPDGTLSEKWREWEKATMTPPVVTTTHDMERKDAPVSEMGLGRVVWSRSAWERWASHPTVRSLEKGLGWIWSAVVWLIAPG